MKKILIIEDDQFIRDIYHKAFSVAGFDVQVAVDGQDGYSKVKSNNFDVILLDVLMPDKSGIEVLRDIRSLEEAKRNTPVFMTTNTGQQEIVDDAESLKISGYIIKSQIAPQLLVEKVNSFLEIKD